MHGFGNKILRAFAISLGKCCPKNRGNLDVIMKRIARDPILLEKLPSQTVVEVSSVNGHVSYNIKGKKKADSVKISIRCLDATFFEAVLNGENLDKLRLWAEEKIQVVGDLEVSMILTDAFFRYAELIGQLNLPWYIYRLFGRNLIQEGSCIPSKL